MNKTDLLTRGDIARMAGKPTAHAIFWHEAGYLTPVTRTEAGIFLFERAHVEEFMRLREANGGTLRGLKARAAKATK